MSSFLASLGCNKTTTTSSSCTARSNSPSVDRVLTVVLYQTYASVKPTEPQVEVESERERSGRRRRKETHADMALRANVFIESLSRLPRYSTDAPAL